MAAWPCTTVAWPSSRAPCAHACSRRRAPGSPPSSAHDHAGTGTASWRCPMRALRKPVRQRSGARELREAYAMKDRTVEIVEHRALTASSGGPHGRDHRARSRAAAASADVASKQVTYTNNWPYEPLVGNTPTPSTFLLVGVQRAVPDRRHRAAGLALRAHAYARNSAPTLPATDPLRDLRDHAVDARDREVLLGGARAVPDADPARRDHRALPGRRPGVLRLRALRACCPIR